MRNLLIVVSGPSGVGKGTIVNRLLKSGQYSLSISCTTRAPREGEKDGVHYFFVSEEKFRSMIKEGGFLEYSNHFAHMYGTPRFFVEEQLKSRNVILEIDVDGALQVKKAHPEALLIMIAPPSEEELIKRLKRRGTESDEKIAERVSRMNYELSKSGEYDCTVVNDDLEEAVLKVEEIINSKRRLK